MAFIMKREEIEPFVGKFIEMDCRRDIIKTGTTLGFTACGEIVELNDDSLKFKDNDNYVHTVQLVNVNNITEQGKRRTKEEYQEILQKEAEKEQKRSLKTERL